VGRERSSTRTGRPTAAPGIVIKSARGRRCIRGDHRFARGKLRSGGARYNITVIVRPSRDRAELDAALDLRLEVFCGEQGVSREAEQDGRDEEALHLVALDAGAVVGTCRLLARDGHVLVQRVAVSHARRRTGIGAQLLAEAERQARRRGASALELHAQVDSEAFYRSAGYESVGDLFLEEGIEHVAMRRALA
jgi:predicted GNAT family N-acyltransferase